METWTTADEMEFIQGLGTHCPTKHLPARTRQEYLQQYIEASRLRQCWGNLNAERILAYAVELLQKSCASTEEEK